MKKDNQITKVSFWMEPDFDNSFYDLPKDEIPKSEVFAFFPDDIYSDDKNVKTCYAHIGQHSSCHIDYLIGCQKATKEQYADLYSELTQIGYNLKVV
jgi:hypothetical protein